MTATTHQIPWLRVFVEGVVIVGKLAIILLFVSCAPTNQRMVARTAPPDDMYSCYLQVLAEMEYDLVEEADRSSGVIRVLKVGDSGSYWPYEAHEATVAIAPDSTGDSSNVSVTIRRFSLPPGLLPGLPSSDVRSRNLRMTEDGWRDLETLSEACVPPTRQS